LLDEHIPSVVAGALRRRGIDAQTASEAGLRGSPDAAYLAHGSSSGRVIVTNDPDFLQHHEAQTEHAGIAFCEQTSRTIGQLVEGLVLIYEVLEPSDMVGRVEYP
jgi:predicted nuclease of predicted toxin-antitoxin system